MPALTTASTPSTAPGTPEPDAWLTTMPDAALTELFKECATQWRELTKEHSKEPDGRPMVKKTTVVPDGGTTGTSQLVQLFISLERIAIDAEYKGLTPAQVLMVVCTR